MGSLYKRKQSANWYVKYIGVDGEYKYRSTKTTNINEARSFLVKVEREIKKAVALSNENSPYLVDILTEAVGLANAGKLTTDKTRAYLKQIHHYGSEEDFPEYTFSEWVKHHRNTFEQDVSDSTRKNNNTLIIQYTKYLKKDFNKDITLITTPILRKLVVDLKNHTYRGKKSKNSSINHKISYLKTLFKTAYQEGIIDRDVSAPIRLLAEDDSIRRGVFTDEEIRKIIDESEIELSAITRVGVTTGLRLENVKSLKVDNVNLEKMLLIVTPVKQRASKKLIKKLSIPITEEYREFYTKLVDNSEYGFLFPQRARQGKTNLTTAFSNNMIKLGIPKVVEDEAENKSDRTFHSLRHTFNTNLSNKDVPIEIRKLVIGHSKDNTNKIYTHHRIDTVREAMKKVAVY